MQWNAETRYKMLLEINNAVVTRTNREDLFQALAKEVRKHVAFDRMAINLYDAPSNSISYFAAADGVQPGGVLTRHSRPLADGAIARMVVQSRQPTIIDDLRRYKDLSSIGAMVAAGLTATMAFPMLVRNRILGSIHFSFRNSPEHISELTQVLTDVSRQVAIAVDNMLAYTGLENMNRNLEREKAFLLQSSEEYPRDEFFHASAAMAEIMRTIGQVADTDATVLIKGETGTGKELWRAPSTTGARAAASPFVEINCAGAGRVAARERALRPRERRLHRRARPKRGPFELADGGTLFLDEIGDMPSALQAKLLRVLQEGEFERVGGDSRPCRSTCGSSPPRTATWHEACGRGRSGKTSTTG